MQDKIKTIPEELNDNNLINWTFELETKNSASKVKIKVKNIKVNNIKTKI